MRKRPDALGNFLRQYAEYLDGSRSYDDLPCCYCHGVGLDCTGAECTNCEPKTHSHCGAECGRHGDLIAGYTYHGRGQTTIHLTPKAQEGLTVKEPAWSRDVPVPAQCLAPTVRQPIRQTCAVHVPPSNPYCPEGCKWSESVSLLPKKRPWWKRWFG